MTLCKWNFRKCKHVCRKLFGCLGMGRAPSIRKRQKKEITKDGNAAVDDGYAHVPVCGDSYPSTHTW